MLLIKPLVLSSLIVSTTSFVVTKFMVRPVCRYLVHQTPKNGKSKRTFGPNLNPKVASLPREFDMSLGMKLKKGGEGRGMVPKYTPKSENQQAFVRALENMDIPLVFVLGPAGTGKTLFACLTAIQGLRSGEYDRIVITRPLVTVEEELGFLPGNIKSKMDPWTRPIFDIFLEYYSQKDIDAMLNSGMIEIAPLAFMRGRTFKRCFILADEMQNSSPAQMLMAATRIGYGSKMVVNGDLNQSDRGVDNGLAVMVGKVRAAMMKNSTMATGIALCDMDAEDIERSPIVSTILRIYGQTPPRYLLRSEASLTEAAEAKLPLEFVDSLYTEGVDFPHTFGVGKITNNEGRRPVRDPSGVSTLVELFVEEVTNNEGRSPVRDPSGVSTLVELFDRSSSSSEATSEVKLGPHNDAALIPYKDECRGKKNY